MKLCNVKAPLGSKGQSGWRIWARVLRQHNGKQALLILNGRDSSSRRSPLLKRQQRPALYVHSAICFTSLPVRFHTMCGEWLPSDFSNAKSVPQGQAPHKDVASRKSMKKATISGSNCLVWGRFRHHTANCQL